MFTGSRILSTLVSEAQLSQSSTKLKRCFKKVIRDLGSRNKIMKQIWITALKRTLQIQFELDQVKSSQFPIAQWITNKVADFTDNIKENKMTILQIEIKNFLGTKISEGSETTKCKTKDFSSKEMKALQLLQKMLRRKQITMCFSIKQSIRQRFITLTGHISSYLKWQTSTNISTYNWSRAN